MVVCGNKYDGEFKNGKLVEATSEDEGANKLLEYIKTFHDDKMFKPGEFGIGLNKKSKCRGICYIEDESVYSTFHIGMGRNITLGGEQMAAGHFDIITHKPTIYADETIIMKDGEIVETGNHEELIKKNGYYNELYNSL